MVQSFCSSSSSSSLTRNSSGGQRSSPLSTSPSVGSTTIDGRRSLSLQQRSKSEGSGNIWEGKTGSINHLSNRVLMKFPELQHRSQFHILEIRDSNFDKDQFLFHCKTKNTVGTCVVLHIWKLSKWLMATDYKFVPAFAHPRYLQFCNLPFCILEKCVSTWNSMGLWVTSSYKWIVYSLQIGKWPTMHNMENKMFFRSQRQLRVESRDVQFKTASCKKVKQFHVF